jgi:hypothetical protein
MMIMLKPIPFVYSSCKTKIIFPTSLRPSPAPSFPMTQERSPLVPCSRHSFYSFLITVLKYITRGLLLYLHYFYVPSYLMLWKCLSVCPSVLHSHKTAEICSVLLTTHCSLNNALKKEVKCCIEGLIVYRAVNTLHPGYEKPIS